MPHNTVCGTFHQGQIFSPYAGMQCTGIAFFALLVAYLQGPGIMFWQAPMIDNIMHEGHQLYSQVIQASSNPTPHLLGHWELPHQVEYSNTLIQAHMYADIFTGVVGVPSDHDFQSVSLEEAILGSNTISDFTLLTFGAYTTALIQTNGIWHLFDSHSLDNQGNRAAFGTACMNTFSDMDSLLQYLNSLYPSQVFQFTPVVFDSTVVVNQLSSQNVESQENNDAGINYIDKHLQSNTRFMDSDAFTSELGKMSMCNNPVNNTHGTKSTCITSKNASSEDKASTSDSVYDIVSACTVHHNMCFTSSFLALQEAYLGMDSPVQWNNTSVTDIIMTGFKEFPEKMKMLHESNNTTLYDTQSQTKMYFYTDLFEDVLPVDTQEYCNSWNLKEAFSVVQNMSDFTVVHCKQYSFAVWFQQKDHKYFLFDAHQYALTNESTPGHKCIHSFMCMDDLLLYIIDMHQDEPFTLTPIVFESFHGIENRSGDVCTDEVSISPVDLVMGRSDGNQTQIVHTEEITKSSSIVNLTTIHGDRLKYERSLRIGITDFCQICHVFLFADQVCTITAKHTLQHQTTLTTAELTEGSTLCSKCFRHLRQNCQLIPYDLRNMEAGMVPDCIQCLSTTEKRLISQIQSYLTILVLPGGQFAEKGMAIHFPLNLTNYCEQLNQLWSENVVLVTQESNSTSVQIVDTKTVARMQPVRKALEWLKMHNTLYKDFSLSNEPISMHKEFSLAGLNFNSIYDNLPQCSITSLDYTLPSADVASAMTMKKISLPVKFNEPKWIHDIEHGEELCFPWLFPYGQNGMAARRDPSLTLLQYYHQRLYNQDSRWRKNITYLMNSVNHYEQTKLRNDINIYMRVRKPGPAQQHLTAGNVSSIRDNPDLIMSSFMFMKHIRGTVAYWTDILYNLLAMVKCIGPPTLFLTLSADDNHWPELASILHNIPYEEAWKLKSTSSAMHKDPLLASINFERRWNFFFKYILNGKEQPLGKIEDWFARVEYQNRGSPHLHVFLWIRNAPSIQSSTESELIAYIDRVISTQIPSKQNNPVLHDLVQRLQIH